jgi:hypothetical protein
MEGVNDLSLLSAAKNLGCLGGNVDPSLRSAVTFLNNPGKVASAAPTGQRFAQPRATPWGT